MPLLQYREDILRRDIDKSYLTRLSKFKELLNQVRKNILSDVVVSFVYKYFTDKLMSQRRETPSGMYA